MLACMLAEQDHLKRQLSTITDCAKCRVVEMRKRERVPYVAWSRIATPTKEGAATQSETGDTVDAPILVSLCKIFVRIKAETGILLDQIVAKF